MVGLNFSTWRCSSGNYKRWGYTIKRVYFGGWFWTPFTIISIRFAHKCRYCNAWNYAPDSTCYMAPDGSDSRHFPDELQPSNDYENNLTEKNFGN